MKPPNTPMMSATSTSTGDAAWNASAGWRWMLGSESLPALVFLVLLGWVPESPRWLALRGRSREALAVLERVAPPDTASRELALILASGHGGDAPLSALVAPDQRRPLVIAVGLALLSQASGINAIMYYAPEVFRAAGASTGAAFASGFFAKGAVVSGADLRASAAAGLGLDTGALASSFGSGAAEASGFGSGAIRPSSVGLRTTAGRGPGGS
jgi:hypothetical protein